jgi:hypothetical protein
VPPASPAGSAATLSLVDTKTLVPLTSVDFRTRLMP